jgi:hypothetical protein
MSCLVFLRPVYYFDDIILLDAIKAEHTQRWNTKRLIENEHACRN